MDLKSFAEVYWSMQEGKVNPGLQAYLDKKKGKKDNGDEKEEENGKESKGSKPDFLDLDKDGDKKEPMKKAAKEKKMKEEAVIEHHQKDADGKVIEHEDEATGTPSSVEEEKTVLEQLSENGEELDMFDAVVAYLIDEGFAETLEEAQKIMSGLKPELVEEVYQSQLEKIQKSTPSENDEVQQMDEFVGAALGALNTANKVANVVNTASAIADKMKKKKKDDNVDEMVRVLVPKDGANVRRAPKPDTAPKPAPKPVPSKPVPSKPSPDKKPKPVPSKPAPRPVPQPRPL